MKIIISLSRQTLQLIQEETLVIEYAISSAKNGISCLKESGGTPVGKHIIRAKIGAGLPRNSVFVGRRATGEIYSNELTTQFPERDWILSRILWLSGQEVGKNRLGNVDSMQRYIYIHGTPDSEPMGVAMSHGCIRMRNTDMLALFEQIAIGDEVDIQP